MNIFHTPGCISFVFRRSRCAQLCSLLTDRSKKTTSTQHWSPRRGYAGQGRRGGGEDKIIIKKERRRRNITYCQAVGMERFDFFVVAVNKMLLLKEKKSLPRLCTSEPTPRPLGGSSPSNRRLTLAGSVIGRPSWAAPLHTDSGLRRLLSPHPPTPRVSYLCPYLTAPPHLPTAPHLLPSPAHLLTPFQSPDHNRGMKREFIK